MRSRTDRMYMVIAMYYETEIATARLTGRMPTTRQAARDWGVSRPTIDHAWEILRRDCFIDTDRTGTRVNEFRSQLAAYRKKHGPKGEKS
jgi:DNA-binding transcriptional regulator YhcF (GntR family)